MADILVESDTWKVESGALYGPIQTRSISRQIFPVETILQEKDKQVDYWKWTEDYNSIYQADPSGHPNVNHALAKTTTNVPIIETGFVLNRSEKERVEASMFNMNARIAALAPKIAGDEDLFAIYGEATQDVTSFADTTNNSTAASTELNVTTEALVKSSLIAQITQLKTAVGGYGNLKQFPLILLVTEDVQDKMVATAPTGYAAGDRADNYSDLANQLLLKYGAPGSAVFASPNLGAAVAKSSADKYVVTPGTTNSVLYPWSKDILSVYASPFKSISVDHAIRGIEYDFTERWVPVFKDQNLVIYGGTAVIA